MILELRNLPIEKQEEIKAHYNSSLENGTLLPPFKQFNEFGLKYTTEHLGEIGKFAIFFPVEMMVNYVDAITKKNIDENNGYFISKTIAELIVCNFDGINTTSIGNLAYCYMYSINRNLKQEAKFHLDLIHYEMSKVVKKELLKNKC